MVRSYLYKAAPSRTTYRYYGRVIRQLYLSSLIVSADLGGRVGWLPKAERVKTLFFLPYSPRIGGGG